MRKIQDVKVESVCEAIRDCVNERDTYRELCVAMLSLLKVYLDNGDTAQHCEFKSAITKAETILGEKNGSRND